MTNTQDIALRIFTTLNDRGLQLDDSDIFKAQFYKFYRTQGESAKNNFVSRWKKLEETCNEIFHPHVGSKVSDLFMKYMYYLMAKANIKNDTFPGLRVFYEKDNYEILQSEKTFEDLETLANFWNDIAQRDERRFSSRVLKRLFVLSYSPYALWENIVSLYFMGNRDSQNLLDDEKFYNFLQKITAMFLMQAIVQPGVQAIRRPFFLEFQNIYQGRELSFKDFRQYRATIYNNFSNMKFSNMKAITRAMLTWWMFQDEKQELPPAGTLLEIDYIYSQSRAEREPLEEAESLELLGNKSLVEKYVEIRAAGDKFADKKKYYLRPIYGTKIVELRNIAQTKYDFTEIDILERNEEIWKAFVDYLAANNLLR